MCFIINTTILNFIFADIEVTVYGQTGTYTTDLSGQVSIPIENGITSIFLKVTDPQHQHQDTIHPVPDFVPIKPPFADTIFPVRDLGQTVGQVVVFVPTKDIPSP